MVCLMQNGKKMMPSKKTSFWKLGLFLSCLSLLPLPTQAQVSLPNGTPSESAVDLRVKVLGGAVTIDRQFHEGRWQLNLRWRPAVLSGEPQVQGTCTAYPAIIVQDRSYDGDGEAWAYQNRYSIRATDHFSGEGCSANRIKTLRWQDRNTGQWMEYQRTDPSQFQFALIRYGNRNNIAVSLTYDATGKLQDVRDHFGTVVLNYLYTGDLLTEIRDNPGLASGNLSGNPAGNNTPRSVKYHYTGTTYKGQTVQSIDQVTDVLGHLTKYTLANGTLTGIVDPEGRTRSYQYTADRVTQYTDAAGAKTTYVYDYDKQKREFYVRVTGPAGTDGSRVTETWYDTDGLVIRRDINGKTEYQKGPTDTATRSYTQSDAAGRKTQTVKDEFGNIIKTVYPDGAVTSATYSALHGGVLTETDELGVKTAYEYAPQETPLGGDAIGNLIKKTEAVGLPEQRITEYQHDSYGRIIKETRQGGTETNGTQTPDATWQYQYDTQGNIAQTIDPEGKVRHYVHDRSGTPIQYTDPAGKIVRLDVNAKGQPIQTTDTLGRIRSYAYDKAGALVTETDARGKAFKRVIDVLNRAVKQVDPYGAEFETRYDKEGQVIAVQDASGKRTEFGYDLSGRLVRAKDTSGAEYAMSYLAEDNSDKGLRQASRVQYPTFERRYAFNERNRPTRKTDLDGEGGRVENYAYDLAGRRKTVTYANGKTATYERNAYGDVTRILDPLGNAARFTYDARGNVIEVTDPNGGKTRFAYDRRDLLIKETDPLGNVTLYGYDDNGWLTETTYATGARIVLAWDSEGQLAVQKEYQPGGTLSRTTNFDYDAEGNLIAWNDGDYGATREYDDAGRLTRETVNYGAFSLTHRYGWYPNNQLKSYTGPDDVTVSYAYDGAGQLQSLQIPNEGQLSVTETKWVARKKVLLPGGSEQQYDYDGLLMMTRLKVLNPGKATVFELENKYGRMHEVTTATQDGSPLNYSYDDALRLTGIEGGFFSGKNEGYTVDASGNRLTDTRQSGKTWKYDAANQLTERGTVTYTYDAAGNLVKKVDSSLAEPARTTTYAYDPQNRLERILDGASQVIAAYRYDPFDQRLAKTLGNGTTTYTLYSDSGLLAETDASGQIVATYGWHPEEEDSTYPIYARVADPDNGADAKRYVYYHNDQNGTPLRITDKAGNLVWKGDYDGFGKAVVTSSATAPVTSNLRFPGQYFDAESGLHYNNRRYYDPDTGRYLTRDPIGFEGGINLYAYARHNPVAYTDPSGEILPCLAINYLRCMASCMLLSGASDYLFECGQIDWGQNLKDCAIDCLLGMLPIPNPCGKFGKWVSAALGAASMAAEINSFTPDTLVHVRPEEAMLADAHAAKAVLKPISELKPGDEVLALAEWKDQGKEPGVDQRLSYEKVTDLFMSQREQRLVHLTLENGETLTATDGHPFLTSEGWRDAILLKKGGKLLLKGAGEDEPERWASVADVRIETRVTPVVNLEVANAHTFFVGKDGVGVHNAGGCKVQSLSKREAFRKAKRDAGIPTSQTHNTHTKTNSGDRSGGSATDFSFDGNKSVQSHPNGHPWPSTNGSADPHFNNHQPPGVSGGTKNHYTY